jgi:uncharacterized protein YqeY
MAEALRQRLQADLGPAMKAQDAIRVDVLRAALSAIANAEAPEAIETPTPAPAPGDRAAVGPSRDLEPRFLSEADMVVIVTRERDELDEVAEELESFGEISRADELRQQAAILSAYLSTPSG